MQKSFAKFGIILIQNIRINMPDCIHEKGFHEDGMTFCFSIICFYLILNINVALKHVYTKDCPVKHDRGHRTLALSVN